MARILHRTINIGGFEVFYRETMPLNWPSDRPPLLLLHGFPSSSHQYRGLMQALGDDIRMIAPDYPSFGQTQVIPGFAGYLEFTFERLSEVMEGFIDALGLERLVLYAFDFGGPVGFRVAARRPDLIAGLIVQNANAYDAGLSDAARHFAIIDGRSEAGITAFEEFLSPEGTKFQYLTGAADPAAIAPDGYTLDIHYLERPQHKTAIMSLLSDYKSNLAEYPAWQAWLGSYRQPAMILWGRNDPLFIEAGAHAYLVDLPHAELHFFDTGHFALEECVDQIAPLIAEFVGNIGSKV